MHFLLVGEQTETSEWGKKITVDNMKKIVTNTGNSPIYAKDKKHFGIIFKSDLFLFVLYFNFMRSSS